MTRLEESGHPTDRFTAASRTVRAHADGGVCPACPADGPCPQQTWAVRQLADHPGGRLLLHQLGIPSDESVSIQEGPLR
ncbi:hypothetical protein AWW66_09865 [Micromonospora rosaria]|uniref:Uncharacterized protein n=1 Tax=Micromonospora rosaria TaxID=47874 RepID=A0A136PVE1_9ACTN|nr:hypothetical protein [Micromonospora rosaria]KXK62136.1 hypothetical protein AWW66_09865 [Micromonospora rosaria]